MTHIAIWEAPAEGAESEWGDLVTDETSRSSGIGKVLMEHLQELARKASCESITLDSGTQRQRAHKFYFREGMVVVGFHFAKPLR